VTTLDDGREVSSIGRAIRLLGDRWTLLILRDAFLLRTRRFRVWRESLGISDPVLARRLRDLVDGGVLRRVLYSSAPERHEYLLTESGLELWSLLVAIWGWERGWVAGKAEILPELVHESCGASVNVQLACAACRAVVGARDTAAERSPGVGPERNAPPRFRRRSARGAEPSDPALLFPETMALLGDRWSTVMLAAAFLRTRRFGDFQRDLGVPPTLLAQRLRTMTELDVLRRVPSVERSDRHEYRLTDKGLAFFPIMMLMAQWANRWLATPAGPPVRVSHPACGALLEAVLCCDSCGGVLHRREVHFIWARTRPPAGGLPPAASPPMATGVAVRLDRADGVSSG
jgi:DNA-binding HxlR family transcriptional regulator